MKPILETTRGPTAINYEGSPLQMAASQRASSRFRSDVGEEPVELVTLSVARSALALLSAGTGQMSGRAEVEKKVRRKGLREGERKEEGEVGLGERERAGRWAIGDREVTVTLPRAIVNYVVFSFSSVEFFCLFFSFLFFFSFLAVICLVLL